MAVQAHEDPSFRSRIRTQQARTSVGAGSLDLWRKTYRTAGMKTPRRALSFDILHITNNIDGRPPYNFSCFYRPRSQWPWGLACMSPRTRTELLAGQISTDFFPCRLEICTVLNSNDTGDEPYVREHAGHGTSILGIKEISARGSREEWTGLHWIYK